MAEQIRVNLGFRPRRASPPLCQNPTVKEPLDLHKNCNRRAMTRAWSDHAVASELSGLALPRLDAITCAQRRRFFDTP
jgi:hypothetical protein